MLLILPPVSAPGHKLQKPSKESGIFQSLGTINFVLFTKRQSQKGEGGMAQSHTDIFQTSQTHSYGEPTIPLISGKIGKFFLHPQKSLLAPPGGASTPNWEPLSYMLTDSICMA